MITITRRTVLVVAGASLLALPPLGLRRHDVPSALARAGTLDDLLVEAGTLTAAHMRLYSAPLGVVQSKIVELVPEGTFVRPGDRLIRFDTTALEQALARQQSLLQEGQAEQLRAREEYHVDQLRADSDAASARDRMDVAEQAVANQVDGKGRVDVATANETAAEAARDAEQARKAYEDLKPLLPRGFITRSELEKAGQAAARAEAAAKLANMRAQALADFERPAAIAKARAELSTARDDVARQRDVAAAQLREAAAAAALADARVAERSTQLDAIKAQIAASIVTADGPGFVIYREAYFGGDRRKPQVGDEVSPNQPVIAVPDASRLVVETRVREIDLRRVSAGRPATVQVDALPDVSAPATITLVGALALEDPSRAGTRFFPVTVTLDRVDARLRPGMTARVGFPSPAAATGAIVPLAAVFDADGAAYCIVLDGGRGTRRPVSIAARTDTDAALRSGVRPGERVALVDPDADR